MFFMSNYFWGYDNDNDMMSNSYNISNTNSSVEHIEIKNAVFDELFLDKDMSQIFPTSNPSYTYPTTWTKTTILQCSFEDSLNGGDSDISATTVRYLLVKRREVGDIDYITIHRKKIQNSSGNQFGDYSINFDDYTAASDKEYEYTIVSVDNVSNDDTEVLSEGEPQLGTKVYSYFDGVMICDKDNHYFTQFEPVVTYQKNRQSSLVVPIDSKYPHIISNGNEDYYSGTASGLFLKVNEDGTIKNHDMIEYQSNINDFLNNGKPKLLKDWKGNIWIINVTQAPSVSAQEHDMKSIIQFGWAEIANATDGDALLNNGII